MILAVDVDYKGEDATIAGIVFDCWDDTRESHFYVSQLGGIESYVSGSFYKRELPCILHLLKEHALAPNIIIVDGFVQLDGKDKPGLGAYLYQALNEEVVVIGVAKKSFDGISNVHEVLRGESTKPLYVTALGIDLEKAKDKIRLMHGKFRFPTLLKNVDRLCRKNYS